MRHIPTFYFHYCSKKITYSMWKKNHMIWLWDFFVLKKNQLKCAILHPVRYRLQMICPKVIVNNLFVTGNSLSKGKKIPQWGRRQLERVCYLEQTPIHKSMKPLLIYSTVTVEKYCHICGSWNLFPYSLYK